MRWKNKNRKQAFHIEITRSDLGISQNSLDAFIREVYQDTTHPEPGGTRSSNTVATLILGLARWREGNRCFERSGTLKGETWRRDRGRDPLRDLATAAAPARRARQVAPAAVLVPVTGAGPMAKENVSRFGHVGDD